MIGLLGKKVGMTSVFGGDGRQMAVTVLEVGPCSVVQLKTKEKDGYQAVQLAFDPVKESRVNRSEINHFKKHKVTPKRFVREIRTDSLEGLESGQELHVNNFAVGDYVDVIGTSIGRGFQGVVKRHRFKGGERSHGSTFGRLPGSIGQSAFPSRVFKGVKLPGQMGNKRATGQNLRVEKIDVENHLLTLHGSVPGPKNGYVIVGEAIKHRRPRKWRSLQEGLEELELAEPKKVSKPAPKKAEAKKASPKKKK